MSSVTVSFYLTQAEHRALERKTTTKRGYLNGQIYAGLASIGLIFTLFILASCSNIRTYANLAENGYFARKK